MRTLSILIATFILLVQTGSKLKPDDFERLLHKKWVGTLTYLDYGTNKLEPIPTELSVTASSKVAGSYTWTTVYPLEVSHNSIDEIKIRKDGTMIDDETVKERVVLPDGTLQFVTIKSGKDNNKPAAFRFTYLIGNNTFSRKKEVRYEGSDEWFTRNELTVKAK